MTEEYYDKRKYHEVKYAAPFETSLLPIEYYRRIGCNIVKIYLGNVQDDSFELISNVFEINKNIEKYLEQKLN